MLTATVQCDRENDGRDDDRRDDRVVVNRTSTARDGNALPSDVLVRDFSRNGIGFTSATPFAIGTAISVGLSGGGTVRGTIVRRNRGVYGCAFREPLTHRQLEEAFGVSSVRAFVGLPGGDRLPPPPVKRWPGAARASILLGGIVLSWGAVAATAYAILA